VTFTQISGPPLLAGNVLNPSALGTLLIAASQEGNAAYAPAQTVTSKIVLVEASSSLTNWLHRSS
jgi:hypothetical protein